MEVLRSYAELEGWTDQQVYLTVGFFDGVHLGHQHLLSQMRQSARAVNAASLAFTFTNSPRRYHQPQLSEPEWHYLTTPTEKLALLERADLDATLMLQYDSSIASQTATEFLHGLEARACLAGLCVGYDTSIGRDLIQGYGPFNELCRKLNLDLTWVEPLLIGGTPVKSSRIRQLLQAGEMESVTELLGHRYQLNGSVVRGKGKGNEFLGIPTANLQLALEKLLPPLGVYAGVGTVDGFSYPAAVCLSSQEQHMHTVLEGASGGPADREAVWRLGAVTEAHLVGFSGNIYGSNLQLELVERLRGWQDFDSVESLRRQMGADIQQVVEIVGAQNE